jgi:hypothetical protein
VLGKLRQISRTKGLPWLSSCSTWRSGGRLDGSELLPLLRAGGRFVDGIQQEREAT